MFAFNKRYLRLVVFYKSTHLSKIDFSNNKQSNIPETIAEIVDLVKINVKNLNYCFSIWT